MCSDLLLQNSGSNVDEPSVKIKSKMSTKFVYTVLKPLDKQSDFIRLTMSYIYNNTTSLLTLNFLV